MIVFQVMTFNFVSSNESGGFSLLIDNDIQNQRLLYNLPLHLDLAGNKLVLASAALSLALSLTTFAFAMASWLGDQKVLTRPTV